MPNEEGFRRKPLGAHGGNAGKSLTAGRSWEKKAAAAKKEEDELLRVVPTVRLRAPPRPVGRASLVELGNPDEFIEFHWNPTTYKISKSANWNSGDEVSGTPSLKWGSSGLTVVTCEILLDDFQLHEDSVLRRKKHAKSAEDSIGWLHERLRTRLPSFATGRGRYTPAGTRWLNMRTVAASEGVAPPVLVLFGLSHPFRCVLTQADVTTIIQGGARATKAAEQDAEDAFRKYRTATTMAEREAASDMYRGLEEERFNIVRAKVQLTLKEYTFHVRTKK